MKPLKQQSSTIQYENTRENKMLKFYCRCVDVDGEKNAKEYNTFVRYPFLKRGYNILCRVMRLSFSEK